MDMHRISSRRLVVLSTILLVAALFAVGSLPGAMALAQVELSVTPTNADVTPVWTPTESVTPFGTLQISPTSYPVTPVGTSTNTPTAVSTGIITPTASPTLNTPTPLPTPTITPTATQTPLPVPITFVVTTVDDINDGYCNVSHCSLREAIIAANLNHALDTIAFNIPGSSNHTIQPSSQLPTLTDPVIINATTQPGFVSSPVVQLQGSSAIQYGLRIAAGGSEVRGFVINRFAMADIYLELRGGNHIAANYLGTDFTGTAAWPDNGRFGIQIDSLSNNNTIGGLDTASRNLISGYYSAYVPSGIGLSSAGNRIEGNYIGTDSTGTMVLRNFTGITSYGSNNTIRNNLVSGNNHGIDLVGGGGETIQGNLIGTDYTGTQSLLYYLYGSGIYLTYSSGNQIGGPANGDGNVISASGGDGLVIQSDNNVVQGNLIGTDISGTLPLGNGGAGVVVFSGSNNLIGGAQSGAGNTISANTGRGIEIYYTDAVGNIVQGNFIGTDASRTLSLGNHSDGILIKSVDPLSIIGGPDVGMQNIVAHNQGTGILFTSVGTRARANQIFANGQLGLDLGESGVTPNDLGDADPGRQNFPILSSVTNSGGITSVQGLLNSMANTTFAIEFYSNTTCDPSGYGEGQTYLSSTAVTTDASGDAAVNVTMPALSDMLFMTVTAVDPNGNISEFSPCVDIVNIDPTPTPTIVPTATATPDKPARVVLSSPADGALINSTSPTLSWSEVQFGSTYHLQVATTQSFGSVVVDAMTMGLSYTPGSLSQGKKYWRVQAINSLGMAGQWSATHVFTVDSVPPDVPVLANPADFEFTSDRTPRLSVKSANDAVLYNFLVSANGNFTEILADVIVTSNSFTPTTEFPSSSWIWWKVRARDEAGNWSDFSLYRVFFINQ